MGFRGLGERAEGRLVFRFYWFAGLGLWGCLLWSSGFRFYGFVGEGFRGEGLELARSTALGFRVQGFRVYDFGIRWCFQFVGFDASGLGHLGLCCIPFIPASEGHQTLNPKPDNPKPYRAPKPDKPDKA